MNEDTLVSAHGYAGDAHQILNLMPLYLHHKCPVVVVSPVDSPITPAALRHAPVLYRHGGLRAYIGDPSLEREKQHLKLLLEFPHKWFLMNDSDSLCLVPEIPEYLQREDVFWSNEASDVMHTMPEGWPYPRLAFQPPYFCSRRILEQMVAATFLTTFESMHLKFIDHYLMRLAYDGKVPHRSFRFGVSCPTSHPEGKAHMTDQIKRGGVMLHAIKTPDVISLAVKTRDDCLRH